MTAIVRILAIEDEQDSIYRALVQWRLHGYFVTQAGNLEDAAQQLSASKFDLIVADVRLPSRLDGSRIEQFGGIELIDKLRTGSFGVRNRKTPFMVVTAQRGSLKENFIRSRGDCLGIFDKLQFVAIEKAVSEFVDNMQVKPKRPRGRKRD